MRRYLNGAERLVGETKKACETAEARVDAADVVRKEAAESFVGIAHSTLSEAADVPLDGEPEAWSYTDTLRAAREVDAATPGLDFSRQARDAADDKASRKHRELDRELGADVRVRCDRSRGLAEYEATYNRDQWSIPGLLVTLHDDVTRRQNLLDDEEQELFESFLTGETHQEVRKRLRASHALVARMNTELHERPTASGMTLRLRWAPSDDAPDGAAHALGLMRGEGKLLSKANRKALRAFLRARLTEAQTGDGRGTLEERMAEVLDYRAWHAFAIEYRSNDGGWKKLTRKVHSAGSGGQKALLLHLPLFAAAAAFYESAAPTAPRVVALDEAFAGIDRSSRAQLVSSHPSGA